MMMGTQFITALGAEGKIAFHWTLIMMMCSISSTNCLAIERASSLARQADIIAALSTEGLRGTVRSLHPSKPLKLLLKQNPTLSFHIDKLVLHASRPHTGQNLVAQRLRALLVSDFYPSTISQSHVCCGKVQDAYSIRCIPQVSDNENKSFLSSICLRRFTVLHGIQSDSLRK